MRVPLEDLPQPKVITMAPDRAAIASPKNNPEIKKSNRDFLFESSWKAPTIRNWTVEAQKNPAKPAPINPRIGTIDKPKSKGTRYRNTTIKIA